MTKLVKNIRKQKKATGTSFRVAFFYDQTGLISGSNWIYLNVQHLEVGIYQ